jgi:hypothetical protein
MFRGIGQLHGLTAPFQSIATLLVGAVVHGVIVFFCGTHVWKNWVTPWTNRSVVIVLVGRRAWSDRLLRYMFGGAGYLHGLTASLRSVVILLVETVVHGVSVFLCHKFGRTGSLHGLTDLQSLEPSCMECAVWKNWITPWAKTPVATFFFCDTHVFKRLGQSMHDEVKQTGRRFYGLP